MPYIKTQQNLKWYYEEKGKGAPILFIHGWAGDSGVWYQQISFFSKKFKTIVFDLPGHGKSSWEESNLNQLAGDIDFILNEINIPKITIVALSLAGLIALKFALMFSEKMERLILVDTAARFVSDSEKDGITLAQIDKLSSRLEKDYFGALLFFTRSQLTKQGEGYG
jgi:Predicted hydrolases or acyltransferases (alpha/beta hydrolase superfamily)